MEMEGRPASGSKVWNIIRIVVFMVKKGISKSKTKLYLNFLVKRGKILASKAIMLHHLYASFTCRSQDSHISFISPSDYEFSCTNTPNLPFRSITKNYNNKKQRSKNKPYKYNDVSAFHAFPKKSPTFDHPEVVLPGFGKSPIGRQLRITDSPFLLKEEDDVDDDGDVQVDQAAEEFINKFYTDLSLQKRMAASDSPYSNFWDR